MTWRGMYNSGVGIRVELIRVIHRPTHVVPHLSLTGGGRFGGAIGVCKLAIAGLRIASATLRVVGTAASDSAVSYPKVSKLKARAETGGRACVEGAPACSRLRLWPVRDDRNKNDNEHEP